MRRNPLGENGKMPGDEALTSQVRRMTKIIPNPPKIEIDFTDAQLTGQGGWALLSRAARRLDLPRRLSETVGLKRSRRGASDAEMLWSLIASLAAGNGALSDVDALRTDAVNCRLLGLAQAPSSRRLGEYLCRFDSAEVAALQAVVRDVTRRLSPAVIAHEVERRGYVPVFVDGSAIEVDGALFEGADKGYNGTRQYWLHGVFVGPLWVSGRLHPGGVAPLLNGSAPVWMHADNAYYRRDFVRYCRERGWDYSVSVTHGVYRRPILGVVEGLDESAWEDIGLGE